MFEIVKDSNKNYKVVLDKKEEADNRENEKHLARKRKKEMIKEVKRKKDYC